MQRWRQQQQQQQQQQRAPWALQQTLAALRSRLGLLRQRPCASLWP